MLKRSHFPVNRSARVLMSGWRPAEQLGEYPGIKGSPSWYTRELCRYTRGSYVDVLKC